MKFWTKVVSIILLIFLLGVTAGSVITYNTVEYYSCKPFYLQGGQAFADELSHVLNDQGFVDFTNQDKTVRLVIKD